MAQHKRIEVRWERLGRHGDARKPGTARLYAVDDCMEHSESERTGRLRPNYVGAFDCCVYCGKGDEAGERATDGCDCALCLREWDALRARYGEGWDEHPAWERPQPYPVLIWWPERDEQPLAVAS